MTEPSARHDAWKLFEKMAPAEPFEPDHADVGPGKQRGIDVDRIGRRRNKCRIAGTDEHPHEVREPLLRPDRRHDLPVGVDADPETPLVQIRNGRAQLRNPSTGGVAVVARVAGRLAELLDGDVG